MNWKIGQIKKKMQTIEKCMTDKIGDMAKSSNKCVTRVPEEEIENNRRNKAEEMFRKHYKL